MKINNETKIGLFAIVAILVFILGFRFLKGKSLFSKQPAIYAVFDNLASLEKSNVVKINGLPIGTVYDFAPTDKEVNNIIVEIHLTRDIKIPANSVAFIDATLVGASFITIEKGDANQYLQYGDTISTRIDPSLISNLKTQITPTITRVNTAVDSLTLLIGNVNQLLNPSTNNNLQSLIANLTIASANLQHILNAETGLLATTAGNLNAVTGNLAKNNDQIAQSIRNVELATGNIANAPIQQTVTSLQETVAELRNSISKLDNNLNNNNGTLGRLLNDQQLYNQMNQSALALEILLDDLRLHPKRYVNISVFGGKNKPAPLTSPLAKDTVTVIVD